MHPGMMRQRAPQRPIGAVRARVSRTSSAGGSSTCRPRLPALTMTVAKPIADSSTTVGSAFFLPERADPAEHTATGRLLDPQVTAGRGDRLADLAVHEVRAAHADHVEVVALQQRRASRRRRAAKP